MSGVATLFAAAGGLMDVFGAVDTFSGLVSIAERFPVVSGESDQGVSNPRSVPPASAPEGGFRMPGVPYPTKYPDMEKQREAQDKNLGSVGAKIGDSAGEALSAPGRQASEFITAIGGRIATIAIGASLTLLGIYFLLREAAPSAALAVVKPVADALEEK